MGCFHSGFQDRAAFERGTAARATGLLHLNNARPCGKRCLCEISKRNRSVCTRLIRRLGRHGEMSWRENEQTVAKSTDEQITGIPSRTVSILSYEEKQNFPRNTRHNGLQSANAIFLISRRFSTRQKILALSFKKKELVILLEGFQRMSQLFSPIPVVVDKARLRNADASVKILT